MTHPAFEHIRTESIPTLRIDVEEYRHRTTGAKHFHLRADDNNNAFLVAFLTVPQDSTGVAHILEHTSLCGSERFPVRDPFFMMTRRSLNTFMNAFTSSDWTAYPFASQNLKDFNNLLDVYLDAVFFPRLDPLDFAQEGHRVEFAEADNPESELVYKGVVFNEMKGAMSSPVRTVWQTLQSELFPTITYHHNSGGEPADIPNLSYDQLKAFHARHYHPSNALFMTYGDIPAADHQGLFEDKALAQFQREEIDLSVPAESRYEAPRNVTAPYALDGDSETTRRTHVNVGWLLGQNTDLTAMMEAHLLSGVLLDNSASPLRHALEVTDLGASPSELCGMDDSTKEMVFVCGVEGSEPDHAEKVENLVMTVLEDIAHNGVPREQVEAVLHQLELSQREVGGGHFPYGLQLMVNALNPAIHGGDPVGVLNLDPVLEQLHASIRDDDYIKGLVRRLLLDNPHRVRLVMHPDPEMSSRSAAEEAQRLAAIKAELDESEKSEIVALAAKLNERQMQQDDPEVLPKVTLDDVPDDIKIAEGDHTTLAGMPATWFSQGTNGLVYQQLVVDLPELDQELSDLYPLFCDALNEVGVGELDYLQTQGWQAAVTGGIGARVAVRGLVGDASQVKGLFVLSGKALVRNQAALTDILHETLLKARFDELPRLREIVAQARVYREGSITDRGHSLAITAAAAGLAPTAALSHRWSGLEGVRKLKALDDALNDEAALSAYAEKLKAIQQALLNAPRQVLLVGEAEQRQSIAEQFENLWESGHNATSHKPFQGPVGSGRIRQAWATSTQVNFCAKAFPAAPSGHPDAAPLSVLGGYLRNGFLHRAIREQGGAYGSGAGWDSDSASFRFYSYRDPRIEGTFNDFDASVDWLINGKHEAHMLEEAILGVVSGIDRPDSPAGEAISSFYSKLHGRTPELRRQFRSAILKTELDDLKRVAEKYLLSDSASMAVVTDPGKAEEVKGQLNMDIESL